MSLADYQNAYPRLWRQLLEARRNDRIAHAYLLVGDDAEFLNRFALAWIQVCACRRPTSEGDACGECKSCRQLLGGYYPELYELRPRSKSRQILVDEMHDFEHQFRLTADPSYLKAGLIIDADRLNPQAQNAFLKTLEEPPARTMLVLVTTQPRQLLPTIRSRCQAISLIQNRRSYELAREQGLFEQLARLQRNAGAGMALAVAHRVNDLLNALKTVAEQTIADDTASARQEMADQDPDARKRLDEVRQAQVQAEYLRLREQFAEAIQTWFLQLSLMAAKIPREALPHPEILTAEQGLRQTENQDWTEAEEDARQAAEMVALLNTNANERLVIETFCLTICKKFSN